MGTKEICKDAEVSCHYRRKPQWEVQDRENNVIEIIAKLLAI